MNAGSAPGYAPNWRIRDPYFSIVLDDVVAVPGEQSRSNCRCNQSAFILSNFLRFRKTMHEIRCVRRKYTESYKWVHLHFESNIQQPGVGRSQFKLVSSFSSTIVLYVPATRTLWKFENETWRNASTIPNHLQPFQDISQLWTFGCAVATDNINYVVFNIRDKKVLKFDLESNNYSIENIIGDIPESWYGEVVSSAFKDHNTIIVFTSDWRSSRTRIWKFYYENKFWIWKIFPNLEFAPSFEMGSNYDLMSNYLTFSILLPDVPDQRSLGSIIWSLDLTSMQWWFKIKKKFSYRISYDASCWIGSCCFIALSTNPNNHNIDTWLFNASDNEWSLLTSTSSLNGRSAMSFVAANETTAILFGGTNLDFSFNETWIMHLEPKLQWRQCCRDVDRSVRPKRRSNHAVVMMQSKMYVFGGQDASSACLNDLWVFDVNTEKWSELTFHNTGPNLSKRMKCYYSAASTPGQLLITVMHSHANSSNDDYDFVQETWMFIVYAQTWHLITSVPMTKLSAGLQDRISLKSFYWKGFLIMFNIYQTNIKYLAIDCPAGFTSSNISDRPCKFCKLGFYRETLFANPNCVPCPNGLTTVNTGGRRIEECTLCDVNHCKYGKCVPQFSEGSLRTACQCYVGFTGSTCQYPTYFLIGAGIILFVALASTGATAYFLLLKRKNIGERVLQRKVDVLTNVWQIDEDEVMSGELLGSGASGSVYKASYRNFIVAVKKMMAASLPKSIEDFETEIMFMRTVRHKNIVLFIGAGKSQPGDVPFLVMEYMERGSLKDVLYDLSIDIDYDRKLSFAMDSARGMHFLHTLEPPRIHRDLKSDNLLVSRDWIVKVADFGLGRDVTGNITRDDRKKIECRQRSNSHHISLLSKRDSLSFSGVGTARWRAPEFALREPYNTSVDVYRYYKFTNKVFNNIKFCIYSFGIVLWEIWTRQLPFDKYRFDYQVSDAVVENERPVIPQDCPQPFAMIMKSCWSPIPSDRLSFDQVISQLESLESI